MINMGTEPQWLQEKRKEAESLLDELPDETVRYVVIPASKPADSKDHDSGYAAAIVQHDSQTEIRLPEGIAGKIVVKNIQDALQDEKLAAYFEEPKSRQSAANIAFFNSGVFIFVPDNTVVEEPVYHVMAVGEQASVVSRNIIVAGKNSKVKIIKEITGKGEGQYSEVTVIKAMEQSAIELLSVQNLDKANACIKRHASCEAGSLLDMRTAFFGSENTYARNEIDLDGEGAETSTTDIYFGTGTQKFDSFSLVNHKARNTRSRSDVRGALKDLAKLAPHGNVKIEKQAHGSDAFLTEHILILNAGAEADPVPALEIETRDVKAGHSASVSHMGEEQVFYLLARGIDEPEARKMIALGFLEPAMKMAESLRMHVMSKIEQKWDEKR